MCVCATCMMPRTCAQTMKTRARIGKGQLGLRRRKSAAGQDEKTAVA